MRVIARGSNHDSSVGGGRVGLGKRSDKWLTLGKQPNLFPPPHPRLLLSH